MQGERNYLVRSSSGFKYTGLVNDSGRVLHLQLAHVEPKDESYKDYSYNDAKALATNFVKTKNIIGEDYTLSTDRGTELKEDKENTAYYFYFEYDDNKECLVLVNKGIEKVEQIILLDEINGLG